ncbi:MAG TPA: hypothetical protein PLV83_01975 [Bacilli bacterium]|nr:hypothetical protein [Bacilli bacterium]
MGEMISFKNNKVERLTERIFNKIQEQFYLSEAMEYMECDIDFDEVMIYVECIYNLLEKKKYIYAIDNVISKYIDDIIILDKSELAVINIEYLIGNSLLIKDNETINVSTLDIMRLILNASISLKLYRNEIKKEEKIKIKSLKNNKEE